MATVAAHVYATARKQTTRTTPEGNLEVTVDPKLTYRADIDGLRAIAVISVVVFHAFPSVLPGGFTGVDIFFVISGYLITSIVLSGLDRSHFSLAEFYSRRVRRILPSLVLVLITCLAFGWIALFPDELARLGKHAAAGVGFVSNLAYWSESGYFDADAATKPLLHLWSLGIEEQFYIAWPLVLYLAWKARVRPLTLIVSLAALSFASNVGKLNGDSVARFYSPQTRSWELLFGAGLAYITLFDTRTPARLTLRNRSVQSMLGAALLVTGILLADEAAFPGWWAILPTAGTAMLIAAGPHAWVNRAVLARPVLVWIGLISFPLYLWHWPVLTFLRILNVHSASWWVIACGVALSVLLAWLSYAFVERPIRHGTRGGTTTVLLLFLTAATGAAGFMMMRADGYAARITLNSADAASLFGPYPHDPLHNRMCDSSLTEFARFSACLLSRPSSPEVALVGDSHSEQLFQSLAAQLPGNSVVNIAQWRCLPFAADTFERYGDCAQRVSSTLAFLKREHSIRTVYLSGSWNYLAAGDLGMQSTGWQRSRPADAEQLRTFAENGDRILSALASDHRRVVLIVDIPGLGFEPKACIDLKGSPLLGYRTNRKDSCFTARALYEKQRADFQTEFSALLARHPKVEVYDPRPLFCDADACRGTRGDTIVYYNSDHLTRYGADLVVKDLLRRFAPAASFKPQ
jgi:peptidoglycan/LPS O-acetylase OafA/YrhL